jgi:hypothetical protein
MARSIQCEGKISPPPVFGKRKWNDGTNQQNQTLMTYLKVERVPLSKHHKLLILLRCSTVPLSFGKYPEGENIFDDSSRFRSSSPGRVSASSGNERRNNSTGLSAPCAPRRRKCCAS